MNTSHILEQLTFIESAAAAIRASLTPEDPPPPPIVPPAPTLSLATSYGEVTLEFAAAAFDGGAFSLQYRAHATDTTGHGPQEWTDLQSSGTPNLTVTPAADRVLEFRAFCEREGVRSDDAVLVVEMNDYLSTPPVEEQGAES